MAVGSEPLRHLWVIGPGRAGLALGLALRRAEGVERLSYTGRRPAPPAHPLFRTPPAAAYSALLRPPAGAPPAPVVLAVPDGEISGVAGELARVGLPPGTPVLHMSGALGVEALAPLSASGATVGSLHPLAAISDPVAGAERLRGAWFATEGDAAANEAAERVVAALGGRVLRLAPGGKPLYHAAAVFASNYLVTLLAVAERLMTEAGAGGEEGRDALLELAAGALAGVGERGVVEALTGPVARGDAGTVALHLARLSPPDALLYSVLARETLALARRRGLDPDLAARIETVLERES
jgi:predicted short-subunit dehydrogenase-like oxidoreductase (DUF2520 family)